MERYARICANIDLDAARDNMEFMKMRLPENTQMAAVIKADGYGHGAAAIAQELEPLPYLWGFAVATPEEAMSLRENGIYKPILTLGYAFPYAYPYLVQENIRPTVFLEETAKQLSQAACQAGRKAKIHIKVDTGMSRIGIPADEEGIAILERIAAFPHLEMEGIYTHFARADETDKTNASSQLSLFLEFVEKARTRCGISFLIRHCANSAAILSMQEAPLDMVRAGIALYGMMPSLEMQENAKGLKPAMSLTSHIVYVKEIEPGCPVSYGGAYVAKRKTKIATIPAGYADGYPRELCEKGYVLVRGQRAPITGRICMDQFMADVTDILGVTAGDSVTLLGADGKERITMEQLSAWSGRFHYELSCGIGKRVPRIYKKDNKI